MHSGLEKVSLLEQTPNGSIGGAVGGLGLTPLSNSNFGSNSHFGTARTAQMGTATAGSHLSYSASSCASEDS
jgi:hypothetical protein